MSSIFSRTLPVLPLLPLLLVTAPAWSSECRRDERDIRCAAAKEASDKFYHGAESPYFLAYRKVAQACSANFKGIAYDNCMSRDFYNKDPAQKKYNQLTREFLRKCDCYRRLKTLFGG